MRVVLAGGGSAGHIEPALAVADALRRADPHALIICLGTERGLEGRLVPMRGYELAMIPAVPMPRSVTPRLLAVPGKLAGAVSAAAGVLDRMKADVLVGFGGYVSTPGYLAARRRHVPIVVHEANPRPGLANKLGARLTENVFTGHPATQLAHATYLGIPIRREIAELDRLGLGDKARAHFGLRPDLPVLLVTGGSQGARSLNSALYGALDWLRSSGVQVLHVTGPHHEPEAPPPAGAPYVAVPYVDRMDLAYAAADFALCRAGAMTCAELTAVGLPAAYVPLPHGNGEQRLNAEPVVSGGGGLLVEDAELTPEWIRDVLLPVLLDIDRVANMSEAAAALGRKDADRAMADAIINVVRTSHELGGPAGYAADDGQAGPDFQAAPGQPVPGRQVPPGPMPSRPPAGAHPGPVQPGPGQPGPGFPPQPGQPGSAFQPAPGVRRSPGAQGTPRFEPAPGQPPMPTRQPRPGPPLMPGQQPPMAGGRPAPGPALMPGGRPAPGPAPMPGGRPAPGPAPMPGPASMPGPAAPGPAPTAKPPAGAPAGREQWFEPRSRRAAEVWGSTDPAAPRPAGPPRPDDPRQAAAPGGARPPAPPSQGAYPPPQGAYPPPQDAAPRRDGPPWAEAEPQPQPEQRRPASRRGQPRHGRHR
jgi:UDP-N-acetylglucosamine--N-acetylmuramyl-(pentapeptide) pyrophosphoryl-undecaprenol N-acetylglucosamine transferase